MFVSARLRPALETPATQRRGHRHGDETPELARDEAGPVSFCAGSDGAAAADVKGQEIPALGLGQALPLEAPSPLGAVIVLTQVGARKDGRGTQ